MLQVEFTGLTGKVAFDKYGLRKDYKLDVMEITLSESQRKVGITNIHILKIIIQIVLTL